MDASFVVDVFTPKNQLYDQIRSNILLYDRTRSNISCMTWAGASRHGRHGRKT